MRLTRRSIPPLLAVTLSSLLGCGPTVSLDDPTEVGSSGTSTGAGPFGPLTTADDGVTLGPLDEGPWLDLGNAKLDVAPDVPLPPGSCPPDCQLELGLSWVYDGFADGSPLDPEDRVAVIVEPGGTIVVAEERQGQLELARLSQSGQELWTMPLALPCDPCRLVDLGLHPSGDLLLAGYGVDAGMPAALAARVELGGPQLVWATSTALTLGAGVAPRAGSLVVHDETLLFQPVLEGTMFDGTELLRLLAYDPTAGSMLYGVEVTNGVASGDAPPPLAAYDTRGTLVLTHPAWTGAPLLSGTVSWLSTATGELLATGSRVEPSLRLAAAPDGRVVTLGKTSAELQSLLYLESGDSFAPEGWQIIYVLPTVTSSTPALAVDGYGHAHVVARTAAGDRPGHEGAVALEVLRWSHDGNLVWKLSLPVALDHVDEPVSLALAFDEALVIGGFVAGARHVEHRVPECVCF